MANTHYTFKRMRSELADHPDAALVFEAGDDFLQPGYHVTEIKQAAVSSLDCGKGTDQWNEVIIQLLDGRSGPGNHYMLTSKFLSILESLNPADESDLYFEFPESNGVIRKLSIHSIDSSAGQTRVALAGEKAVCKPAVRARASGGSGGCCS